MVLSGSSICDFFCCYKLPKTENSRNAGKKTETEEGRDSLTCPKFWRAIAAEFIALVLFIPLAVGSSVPWTARNEPSNTQIAFANGLMIATLIQCFGHVSGAHFNPSVTIPLAWNRDISILRAILYVLAQCAGSSVGAVFLQATTPYEVRPDSIGCTLLGDGVDMWQGLLVEMIITFQLVFVVFATIDPSRKDIEGSSALAIGLSVVTGLLYSLPFTGGSMNPARSFGPALVTGTWKDHWIYWVGPIVAGFSAGNLYSFIFANNASRGKLLERLTCTKDDQQTTVQESTYTTYTVTGSKEATV